MAYQPVRRLQFAFKIWQLLHLSMSWDTLPNFSHLVNKHSSAPDVRKVCWFVGVLIHIANLATL